MNHDDPHRAALTQRPRRSRTTAAVRDLVAETDVLPRHLALPYFVRSGSGVHEPIASLPGVARVSVDQLLPALERQLRAGVRTAVLFSVPDAAHKDATASRADDSAGPVPSALRAARAAFGDELVLITDVCLCAYTDHGHCGLLSAPRAHGAELVIDNDPSLERLAAMAAAHAAAGADLVSPSDMMDGRVAALRTRLDREGFSAVGILSYAVKYASAFYGPFRDAAGSAPGPSNGSGGPALPSTRASYQMDPRNAREALREAALDEREGADMLMVKPALAYLDVLARLRPATTLPLVAYHVSGEYAMLKAAAAAGVLDEGAAMRETLTAIRRAGADLIVTYAAVEAVERGWLT